MDDDTLNRFEQIMHKDSWGGEDPPARTVLRDIGDTMYACREWFESYNVPNGKAGMIYQPIGTKEQDAGRLVCNKHVQSATTSPRFR
jgi:hypothetical protein